MKRTLFFLLIFSSALFLSFCSKKDYSVRFKNNFNDTIFNITAGNANLGKVIPGQTSAYQPFSGSSFIISGVSSSGRQVSGTESVSGKGKHKWTITLTSSGTIGFEEDKL